MYNYWTTSATEEVALRPKMPWVGAAGQFEGFEDRWENANRVPYAYLEYNPVTIDGKPAPAPQRLTSAPPPTDVLQMAAISTDDMKAVTGIYDAGLGARSNETSGKAIMARQREADTSTFHYIDNLARAIRHAGRILVEMIPRIYDTRRVVRVVHEDETEERVLINGEDQQPNEIELAAGIKGIYDIQTGRFDVRVNVGPSYTTKRQEAAESMVQFVQAVPQAGEAAADLIAKNMDWPGADDIAERLKKLLPPQLQDEEAEDGQAAMLMQQVQALGEQLQQAEQQLMAMQDDKQSQIQLKQLDIEQAGIQKQTALIKAQAELQKVKQETETRMMEITAQSQTTREVGTRSDDTLREGLAELIASQIQATQAILAKHTEMNQGIVQAIAEMKPSSKPETKIVSIKAPSGQTYTGTVREQ